MPMPDDMNLPEPTFNSDSGGGGLSGLLGGLFPGKGGGIAGSGFGIGDIGLLGLGGALGGGGGIAAALALRLLPQLLQAMGQGKGNPGASGAPVTEASPSAMPQQTEFYNPAPSLDVMNNEYNGRQNNLYQNRWPALPESHRMMPPRKPQLPLTIEDILAQARGSANGQY